jgi:hypothetical protein
VTDGMDSVACAMAPAPANGGTVDADALRKEILRVILPAGDSGPGRSIIDRLLMVSIVVLDKATAKEIRMAVGLTTSLIVDVLDDLIREGVVAIKRGVYTIDDPAADDWDEWNIDDRPADEDEVAA